MTPTYSDVKLAVIAVIDDFTIYSVYEDYAPNGKKIYGANTELIQLQINAPVLAIMPIRFNKALRLASNGKWKNVGTLDLVDQETIGDLIRLACGQSDTAIPRGEPT